jgi:predicted metal-dependent enzyme (double-stranded beta helix superfamily)
LSTLPQLERLAAHIGAAVRLAPDAMAREVAAALRDATATPDWLPPERRRASHENYARHMLYGDPAGRYSILAIVWDHGQMSPVHDHHCWCAVGVYEGQLTETYYRENGPSGPPSAVSTTRRGTGTLSFEPAASTIHRITNESGAVAISLHIYGVAKDSISTRVNRIFPTG